MLQIRNIMYICTIYTATLYCGFFDNFIPDNPSKDTSLCQNTSEDAAFWEHSKMQTPIDPQAIAGFNKLVNKEIDTTSHDPQTLAAYVYGKLQTFTDIADSGYICISENERQTLYNMLHDEAICHHLKQYITTLDKKKAWLISKSLQACRIPHETLLKDKTISTPEYDTISTETITKELQDRKITENESGDVHENYEDIISGEFTCNDGAWFTAGIQSVQPGAIRKEQEQFNTLLSGDVDEQTYAQAVTYAQHVYKIHLMPRSEDLINVVENILDAYKKLPRSKRYIHRLKFTGALNVGMNYLRESKNWTVFMMPRIVLYPTHDKAQAEEVLSWLYYDVFPNQTGIDIAPRFNKRVSSFIYWLQSNGDNRMNLSLTQQPNLFDADNGYATLNPNRLQKHAQQLGYSQNTVVDNFNNSQELAVRSCPIL